MATTSKKVVWSLFVTHKIRCIRGNNSNFEKSVQWNTFENLNFENTQKKNGFIQISRPEYLLNKILQYSWF